MEQVLLPQAAYDSDAGGPGHDRLRGDSRDHSDSRGFPKLSPHELVKKWQRSFFYVKNMDPAADYINPPPFVDAAG